MAWIESHQELAQHPKTIRLARLLDTNIPAALGHLHLLWWWTLDYAEDGDLSAFDADDIAIAAQWDGDAERFVEALIECGPGDRAGFLDDDRSIHDWHDFAGRLIEQRQFNRERKARRRDLYNDSSLTKAVKARDGDECRYCGKAVNWQDRRSPDGGTYDHVDPDGGNIIENIVVACRGCNSSKGKRTPAEAGMELLPIDTVTAENRQVSDRKPTDVSAITVPNQTKPNQTKPPKSNAADAAGEGDKSISVYRELFEAIAECWKGQSYHPELLSPNDQSLVGMAASQLREIGATGEEVVVEWDHVAEMYGEITPAGLLKHWKAYGTGPREEHDSPKRSPPDRYDDGGSSYQRT